MDLQEKLNETKKEVDELIASLERTKAALKTAKSLEKQYLKLIEKDKALEK
jgi:lipid II:glycine glycyltransferase (peptidoglycan interpeptide bridge formation enzyme)